MTINSTNLLRRTLAVLGAGLALAASLPAASQGTVTLSNASGNSCQYSTMTVSPNGNITVTCNTVVNPTGATFSVVAATYTTAAESQGTVILRRTGGTGPLNATLLITATGGACDTGTLSLPFAENQEYVWPYQLHASGTCTISLTPGAGHTAGSLSIPIATSGGGTGNPPAGCPALPNEWLYQTMDKWRGLTPGQVATSWDSVDQLRMKAGQIATYDIPNPGAVALVFTQGQQASAPASPITEFTVSKCPGVIDTNAGACYYRGTFANNNQMRIYRSVHNGMSSQELLGDRGCFAPANDPNTGAALTWYVNVRWTFATCFQGVGNCGFTMQWGTSSPD